MERRRYGEAEARTAITTYGPELALMARAAIDQYPDLDPPGAILCEPGTSEGESLAAQLDPRLPIRIVDDGVGLVVMSRRDLRAAIEKLSPGCLPLLEHDEFSADRTLPILAVCRDGFLLGTARMPERA